MSYRVLGSRDIWRWSEMSYRVLVEWRALVTRIAGIKGFPEKHASSGNLNNKTG